MDKAKRVSFPQLGMTPTPLSAIIIDKIRKVYEERN